MAIFGVGSSNLNPLLSINWISVRKVKVFRWSKNVNPFDLIVILLKLAIVSFFNLNSDPKAQDGTSVIFMLTLISWTLVNLFNTFHILYSKGEWLTWSQSVKFIILYDALPNALFLISWILFPRIHQMLYWQISSHLKLIISDCHFQFWIFWNVFDLD